MFLEPSAAVAPAEHQNDEWCLFGDVEATAALQTLELSVAYRFGRISIVGRKRRNFSQAMRLTSEFNPRLGEISQSFELLRAETAPQKYVSAGS
jgi:hypothetical protein